MSNRQNVDRQNVEQINVDRKNAKYAVDATPGFILGQAPQ